MERCSHMIVGQIVVFTDDPDLAVRAAQMVVQENLANLLPNGTILIAGAPVEWTSIQALRRYDSWQ